MEFMSAVAIKEERCRYQEGRLAAVCCARAFSVYLFPKAGVCVAHPAPAGSHAGQAEKYVRFVAHKKIVFFKRSRGMPGQQWAPDAGRTAASCQEAF
jgi:hypothetical protein